MRRFLLDTGTAQDFINRRHGVIERSDAERRAGNRIGICTPVLGELWAGVEGSVSRERNLQRLRRSLSRLVVWPYTNDAAAPFFQPVPPLPGRRSRSGERGRGGAPPAHELSSSIWRPNRCAPEGLMIS